ncbi:MAG: hypothetical protein ACOWWM_13560 [Desulfobacterales bacterium]|jgi:hypothetical protein
MLIIGKLRIQLPADCLGRAESIGRMVAEALADRPVPENIQIERLSVPPIQIRPGSGDRRIARGIAMAIHDCLQSERK